MHIDQYVLAKASYSDKQRHRENTMKNLNQAEISEELDQYRPSSCIYQSFKLFPGFNATSCYRMCFKPFKGQFPHLLFRNNHIHQLQPCLRQALFPSHIHLIIGRQSDTPMPRGGARGGIPEKMGY